MIYCALEARIEDGRGTIAIVDRAIPVLADGDVLVRVQAVALNYRDHSLLQGGSYDGTSARYTPLSDACGVVDAVGPSVTAWRPGDRVCSLFFPKWLAGRVDRADRSAYEGVGQRYVALPATALIAAPAILTDIEAATLPCAGVTAWNAIMQWPDLRPGDVLLVQGTGGVSLFALQFAIAAGLRVIVTSSSDEKLERARALGAFATINYRTHPQWADQALALTNGVGVDLIVEVGGAGTFAQSLKAIRVGGHISVVGMLTGATQEIDIRNIYGKNAQIRGVTVGSKADFAAMNRAIETHGIAPVIAHVHPWRDAADAIARFGRDGAFGKRVLDFTAP